MRPYDTSGTDMRSSLTSSSEDDMSHVVRISDYSDARQSGVNLSNKPSFLDLNMTNNSRTENNSTASWSIHQNKDQKIGTPWLSVPSASPTSYGMLQHRLPSPGMFKVGGKNSIENVQINLAHSIEKHASRRSRHFVPTSRKDQYYWVKRHKNNAAARRSREKRRINDLLLEQKVLQLLQENLQLKKDLLAVRVKYNEIDVDEAKEVDRYMNEQKSFVFDFMKEEKLREDNAVDNMEEHGACLHENDHHDTVCRKAMPMEATSSTALVAVVKKCCCSYTGCESEGNDDSYFGGNRCGDIRKEYLRFQEFDAMHIKKESESALASDPFPCTQSTGSTMRDQSTAKMPTNPNRSHSTTDMSLAELNTEQAIIKYEESSSLEGTRADKRSHSPNYHSKQEAAFALASLSAYKLPAKKSWRATVIERIRVYSPDYYKQSFSYDPLYFPSHKTLQVGKSAERKVRLMRREIPYLPPYLEENDKTIDQGPVVRIPHSSNVMPDELRSKDNRVYVNGQHVNITQEFPLCERVKENLKDPYRSSESSLPAQCKMLSIRQGNRPPRRKTAQLRSPSPSFADSNSLLYEEETELPPELFPKNGNSNGSDSGCSMSPQSSGSLQGDAGENFLPDDRTHRLPYKLRFKLGAMATE